MDYIILDANDKKEFRTNKEVLNEVFKNNYGQWAQGTWKPKSKTFRVWFPKLVKHDKKGNLVLTANNCYNEISPDWNIFYYVDLKKSDKLDENAYTGYDLIFAKEPNGKCIFRGVYKLDVESSKDCKFVSRRVATKVKLYGIPVNRIEIL